MAVTITQADMTILKSLPHYRLEFDGAWKCIYRSPWLVDRVHIYGTPHRAIKAANDSYRNDLLALHKEGRTER